MTTTISITTTTNTTTTTTTTTATSVPLYIRSKACRKDIHLGYLKNKDVRVFKAQKHFVSNEGNKCIFQAISTIIKSLTCK